MLARIRLGLRAFEWLPFPWRFSRLDATAREDFMRGMETSRFALHHELLLMAKVFADAGLRGRRRLSKSGSASR